MMDLKKNIPLDYSVKTIWLTGLSGSGKTTLANALKQELMGKGINCYVLDGDVLRTGLNSDLGFSSNDRSENIRRVAELAKILNSAGVFVITALISPYEKDRLKAKEIIGSDNFFEIYLNAPIEICESRDPKGLYKRARKGILKEFTGIDAPYEVPNLPALMIDSSSVSVEVSVQLLMKLI